MQDLAKMQQMVVAGDKTMQEILTSNWEQVERGQEEAGGQVVKTIASVLDLSATLWPGTAGGHPAGRPSRHRRAWWS